MGKDWKYIAYILFAASFYLVIKLSAPRQHNWNVTYHRTDTNPFGGYVLQELATDIFPAVHTSNLTCYELLDTLDDRGNFLSLSTTFDPGEEDVKALLRYVSNGGNAFIAAQYFEGLFADTLHLKTSDYLFDYGRNYFNRADTVAIQMLIGDGQEYYYQRENIYNYLTSYDTVSTSVMAINDVEYPVLIKTRFGNGNLFLSTTPIAFTNISLLNSANYELAELSLSHLPERDVYWTEFYHFGRMEAQTPLRFILQTESLRWAYYVAIISLVLFILFEIKRKQRIIPIIEPLKNTTLEFVGTVGNLYYQSKDHRNIALKRISFLTEQLRVKHGFNLHHMDEDAIKTLARKTGNDEANVRDLFDTVEKIQQANSITEDQLLAFNEKIEKFNY